LPYSYPKVLQTLGDHLRKQRLDLKLHQREVAQILGADTDSVTNWEKNRTAPTLPFLPKIIEFLGYVPLSIIPRNYGEKIALYRKLAGLSQEELARRLRVDPGTLGKWENGKSQPSPKLFQKLEDFFKENLFRD
jgi:transcriptional regulator with XRE-family HTH domain